MGLGKKSKAPSYKSTTVQNPYVSAYINKDGSSGYKLNNFLKSMNQNAESVLPSLYDQLLNPSLDNAVSQARMAAFSDALSEESSKQFENNISSLSQRGMLRSSAAKDMSNKLSEYQSKRISEFANNLLANNTSDTSSLINMFLNQYLLGSNLGQNAYSNALSANQLLNHFNLSSNQQAMAESNNNNYAEQIQSAAMLAAQILAHI